MSVVIWICAGVLALSGSLILVRITRGPSVLDRMVALDVLIAITVCALALEAAHNRHSTTLPILVVLSLVGFVGSVSVARFAARNADVDRSSPDVSVTAPDGRDL